MSCGVGHRRASDLALLRLWCKLAALARIRPLAWEPPYAAGLALKRQRQKKKKKKKVKTNQKNKSPTFSLVYQFYFSLKKTLVYSLNIFCAHVYGLSCKRIIFSLPRFS